MKSVIVGAVAGYAAWTVLWLGGNAVLFSEAAEVVGAGEAYTSTGGLCGVLLLSLVCSLVAGVVASKLARNRPRDAVLLMGALLVATGIAVQAGVWNLMPLWYHLTFLALIVPVSFLGANLIPTTARTATA